MSTTKICKKCGREGTCYGSELPSGWWRHTQVNYAACTATCACMQGCSGTSPVDMTRVEELAREAGWERVHEVGYFTYRCTGCGKEVVWTYLPDVPPGWYYLLDGDVANPNAILHLACSEACLEKVKPSDPRWAQRPAKVKADPETDLVPVGGSEVAT